jgi:hypothetical protein
MPTTLISLKYFRVTNMKVSRWLPTAGARVRVRTEHVGFVVDKAALGQVPQKVKVR